MTRNIPAARLLVPTHTRTMIPRVFSDGFPYCAACRGAESESVACELQASTNPQALGARWPILHGAESTLVCHKAAAWEQTSPPPLCKLCLCQPWFPPAQACAWQLHRPACGANGSTWLSIAIVRSSDPNTSRSGLGIRLHLTAGSQAHSGTNVSRRHWPRDTCCELAPLDTVQQTSMLPRNPDCTRSTPHPRLRSVRHCR